MQPAQYRNLKGINNSSLSEFERSPAHYFYYVNYPDERKETPATLIGSAYHLLIWEPHKFDLEMFVLDEAQKPEPKKDYRNTANKAWKDAMILKVGNRQVISSDDLCVVHDMMDQLAKDPQAWELICACREAGRVEFADQWERDGILYKRKVDGWHPDFICDTKSTDDADLIPFERSIFTYKYDRQGGMYSDADRVHNETEFFNPYYLIAQEKTAPYGVSVHELSTEVLERGAARYRELGKQIQACIDSGKWPGYSSKYKGDVNTVNLPAWAK